MLHEIAMLNPRCCVYVPRKCIKQFYAAGEGGGSGGGYNDIGLIVSYVDQTEKPRTLKLASRSSLERPPYAVVPLLKEFWEMKP